MFLSNSDNQPDVHVACDQFKVFHEEKRQIDRQEHKRKMIQNEKTVDVAYRYGTNLRLRQTALQVTLSRAPGHWNHA